jgi:hypothetical protein
MRVPMAITEADLSHSLSFLSKALDALSLSFLYFRHACAIAGLDSAMVSAFRELLGRGGEEEPVTEDAYGNVQRLV